MHKATIKSILFSFNRLLFKLEENYYQNDVLDNDQKSY